jgi:predicted metal-dependent peptidase
MNGGVQGYIRPEDFNSKTQSNTSNGGTVVYFNANNILNPSMSNNILFSFFAHEFMHIITF